VRRRLIIAIAGVASAAVILFALPLALVLQSGNRTEAQLRLQRDTTAATRAVDLGGTGDPVELPPSRDRLAVYDGSGRRIAGRGPARADSTVRAALRTGSPSDLARHGQLVTAVPLLVDERVTGALRAQRSGAAAAGATRRAWLALIGLAALVVALAALAALLLGRRLARPLERLAAAARRLGEGDFAARAPRGGIREADEIAAALDHTAQRLRDLIARERAFSAGASHQLRTPLAALRLELEALELRADAPPELQAALVQVERLQTTIDTLLAVARDVPRPGARTDLDIVLEELAGRWRGPLAAAARPLHIRRHGDAHVAAASPAIVTEILEILLDNAHRHGAGAVTVTVRVSGGWLAVDVSDTGPGFPDSQRRGEGHGLGLGLADALAHAEGGRLDITRPRPPIVTLWLAPAGPETGALIQAKVRLPA
jgi:signal transduction histidine kinase